MNKKIDFLIGEIKKLHEKEKWENNEEMHNEEEDGDSGDGDISEEGMRVNMV